MNFINHITLNTGHMRKTYPHEVDKELYFILKRIYKESLNENGAMLFDEYKVKGTAFYGGVLITVSKDQLPIITVAVSKFKNDDLWNALHETATIPLKTKADDPVKAPFIADRIEFGAAMNLDSMRWTGDFSRCMGWIVVNPRKIR